MSEALEEAINRWKDREQGIGNYALCPLCSLHFACQGCPVFIKTGEQECERTPYYDYDAARRMDDKDAMKREATKMVKLLESCRQ